MYEFMLSVLIFASGCAAGFIAAAFFAVGGRADEPEDFDGGYRLHNAPPVRTTIWGGGVEDKHE